MAFDNGIFKEKFDELLEEFVPDSEGLILNNKDKIPDGFWDGGSSQIYLDNLFTDKDIMLIIHQYLLLNKLYYMSMSYSLKT